MALSNWTYTLFDAGAIACAIGVALWRHQQWLQQWPRSLTAIGAVATAFLVWDVAVTHVGHWSFNPTYVLGWKFVNIPVEEAAFFLAIPLVSLAVWEWCAKAVRRTSPLWTSALAAPVVTATILATTFPGRDYSLAAAGAAVIIAAWVWLRRPLLNGRQWLHYQIAMLVIFSIANTVLTALPVVLYNPETFSNIRLGSIPLEDFLYNFALTNAVVLAYHELQRWGGRANLPQPPAADR